MPGHKDLRKCPVQSAFASRALLLEIGAHSDTLESALFTADLVADVLAETSLADPKRKPQQPAGSFPGTGTYGIHPAGPGIQIEIFEPKSPVTVPRLTYL